MPVSMLLKKLCSNLFHRRVRASRTGRTVRDAATLVVAVVSLDAPAVARSATGLLVGARLGAVVSARDTDLVLAATLRWSAVDGGDGHGQH